jgi:mitochondrial import inner membrane translocase subunit TIM44
LATAAEKPSLKETVERLQREKTTGEEGKSSEPSDSSQQSEEKTTSTDASDIFRRAVNVWDNFSTELSSTWQELVQSGERKSINKKIVIHPTETAGGDAPYTGPVDIMVIDPELHLTAWERMQKRLASAPIIQNILEKTEEIYEKSGAAKVKERVDHLREDAREAWETSQNPWVYRLSSVYDTVTAESPETRAVKELRVLDPTFTLEDWRQDVVEHTLPIIMKWFLEGRINQLKPWLGEGVFKRMAAEMTAREREGTQIDTHVLGIMNSEIIAVEVSRTIQHSVLCTVSNPPVSTHFFSNYAAL